MQLGFIGVSHKESAIEERESLKSRPQDFDVTLNLLKKKTGITSPVIISTCNRFEVYFLAPKAWVGAELLKQAIITRYQAPPTLIDKFKYFEGKRVTQHLCRVSAGLESMVIGEPQIFGQVKLAYQQADFARNIHPKMRRCFERAFFVAKKIRAETEIGRLAVSVGKTAIELVRKIFPSLDNKRILVIGAGEMAENVLSSLFQASKAHLSVTNRHFAKAVELTAKYNGDALEYTTFGHHLKQVDIVISSTGSEKHILTADQISEVMKKRRYNPMFFMDIAVPRDIDPRINDITNAYVYDIDDLQNVVDSNIKIRAEEAQKAYGIIAESMKLFTRDDTVRQTASLIRGFRGHIEALIENELLAQLPNTEFTPSQIDRIRTLTHKFRQKLLHHPTTRIREQAQNDDFTSLNTLRDLFDLNDESGDENAQLAQIISVK